MPHNVAKVPRLHQVMRLMDPWTELGLDREFGFARAHVSRFCIKWGSPLSKTTTTTTLTTTATTTTTTGSNRFAFPFVTSSLSVESMWSARDAEDAGTAKRRRERRLGQFFDMNA